MIHYVPIITAHLAPSVRGEYRSGKIFIRPDLGPIRRINTILHEVGHALCHLEWWTEGNGDISNNEEEGIAEAVRLLLCNKYGVRALPLNPAYRSYVDDKALKAAISLVRKYHVNKKPPVKRLVVKF